MRQTFTDRVNGLDLSADLPQEVWVKPLSSAGCCQEVVRRVEQELLRFGQQTMETKTSLPSCSFKEKEAENKSQFNIQPPVLVFHENCGTNIRLTNGNITAEKIDPKILGDGVVMSRDAMVANILYEVRVDAVLGIITRFFLGVTSIPPERLVVRKWFSDMKDSIIIMPNEVCYQGISVLTTIGKGLERLQVGSRVGVLVDSSNDLHLYIDGQDQGVTAKRVPQPSFAVFVIWHNIIKVTAISTSRKT